MSCPEFGRGWPRLTSGAVSDEAFGRKWGQLSEDARKVVLGLLEEGGHNVKETAVRHAVKCARRARPYLRPILVPATKFRARVPGGAIRIYPHLAAPFSWRCLEQPWRSPSGSSRRWITRSSRPPAPLACSRGTRSASTATALSRKETDLASAFAAQTRHDADSSSVIAGSQFASYPSRDTTIFEGAPLPRKRL